MTITIDEAVYAGLHKVIGRGNISQFLKAGTSLCLERRLAGRWLSGDGGRHGTRNRKMIDPS
ncbi:hypothetical protein QN360_02105 [Glaciimonas sp. CA11.2]|uniref:hypothetical protein n=1 Tax=Glaciimonas sp. CA11.2 TaxID=3048601 RepID=UPI002AB55B0D|nr:hypothetical protein [Glaciimonas sp. CA11.2]MDY7549167.1 hypothetical protein [Glaciimonas sp. CA11.2]MEB0161698.1 hypothetical protein [Glaciimonas sp. CA11.2]